MKYLKFLFASTFFLLFACKNNSEIKNGIYVAKNNNFYYALDLNLAQKEIKFFFVNPYSERNLAADEIYNLNLSKTKNGSQDFKYFTKGNFKIEGNKLIIENLESDMLPSEQVKFLEAIITNGEISINCETLNKHINGSSVPVCNSKEIIFIKK